MPPAGKPWALRRREQAANAWSRGGSMSMPEAAAVLHRIQLFTLLAESIGASATPQLSIPLPLQPAAPEHLKLVYSRSDTAPDDGPLAG